MKNKENIIDIKVIKLKDNKTYCEMRMPLNGKSIIVAERCRKDDDLLEMVRKNEKIMRQLEGK